MLGAFDLDVNDHIEIFNANGCDIPTKNGKLQHYSTVMMMVIIIFFIITEQ